jgi:hypothetical protein
MKRILTGVLLAMLCLIVTSQARAQLSENFNSRPGTSLSQVPSYLQSHCWQFVQFDTETNNWDPGIEGDGAMISDPNSSPQKTNSIYTPVLDVPGGFNLKFKYAFSNNMSNGNTRYLRIYVTDANNNIIKQVDSINLEGKRKDTIYSYDKTYTRLGSEGYRLLINFDGIGISTRIAIDELKVSVPTLYADGCNKAPVARDDEFKMTSLNSMDGNVTANDYDPDNNAFAVYLVSQPTNGTVVIHDDNSFTFTPTQNFTGKEVTFTYRICEIGAESLCSNVAKVKIILVNNGTLPVSLVDFGGTYKGDGKVQINWSTNFESNNDRFEVERSFDGSGWEKAGTVMASGNSGIRTNYSFTDDIGKNTALKKDVFYRLRQFDKNGRTSVTRILVVRVYNTKSVSTISVTPNPAKSDINVQLQLVQASMATLRIRNASGMEVMKKVQKYAAGSHNILMEGSSNLQPGMYVLEVVINSKERMIVKLIKE